jgi:hypothetical protein
MVGAMVGAMHEATKMCREATKGRQKQVAAKEHEQLNKMQHSLCWETS